MTPLHYSHDSRADVTDDDGYTPLDRATKNSHTEVIEYLKPLSQSSKLPGER